MKVCIIDEGSYPILRGGLSEWAHWLIRTMSDKDVTFDVLCIAPDASSKSIYEKLPNMNRVIIKPLISQKKTPAVSMNETVARDIVLMLRNVLYGQPLDLDGINLIGLDNINKTLLTTRCYWELLKDYYKESYSGGPFIEYYWTMYSLFSLLLDSIEFSNQIPEADVYHCLSTGFAGFSGALGKNLYGTPVVITEQGLYLVEKRKELARQNVSEWYRDQLIKFFESIVKTSYKYANKVVPPCHSHKKIEEALGLDMAKVEVVNNGIDCSKFLPGPAPNNDPLIIGCFARIVPIKGITTLIQAAKLVLDQHPALFLVLGEIQDQEYYLECLKLTDQLGLKDHIKYMGHSNSLEWYHKVDIFTLTSLSEGVPFALLEAMSCGLPSVCTAVGGVPEIIANGAGFSVPSNQPELLAEKYLLLLKDKELRMKLGKLAIRVANEKYTIQQMADGFYSIYQKLIMEPREAKIPTQNDPGFFHFKSSDSNLIMRP